MELQSRSNRSTYVDASPEIEVETPTMNQVILHAFGSRLLLAEINCK